MLVGAVVLLIGVIGLLMPVSVPGPDNGSIGCGNGIAAEQSAAEQADNQNPANLPIINQILPHPNYVSQCQSAVSTSSAALSRYARTLTRNRSPARRSRRRSRSSISTVT